MNLPTCISSNRKIRYTVCFVILITLSVLFFIISVCAGSVQIPLSDIWRQFRGEQDELYAAILFQIRIPRTFAAILLGGALALSGYLLQTFFSQPSRRTFVLGILPGQNYLVLVVDRVLKIFQNIIFCGSDRGGVRRIYAVDVLRASDVTESSEYVIFSADRSDDRLYLFGSHRFSCDICRGF